MAKQKMIIVGRISQEPKHDTNSNGKEYTSVNVAVNTFKGYDAQGQAIEEATYFHCTIWNGSGVAFFNNKLAKVGAMVKIEGPESCRAATFVDENGQTKVRTYVDQAGKRQVSIYRDILVNEWDILLGPPSGRRSNNAGDITLDGEAPTEELAAIEEDEEFPGV